MSANLEAHARRELELIGEEPDVIDWFCRVIAEFSSFGHSGGSAMATIPVLHALLQWQNLTALTNDPAEWEDHTGRSGGEALWQSHRNPEAFSQDGGVTYYLLSEQEAAGSIETTPLHLSEDKGDAP